MGETTQKTMTEKWMSECRLCADMMARFALSHQDFQSFAEVRCVFLQMHTFKHKMFTCFFCFFCFCFFGCSSNNTLCLREPPRLLPAPNFSQHAITVYTPIPHSNINRTSREHSYPPHSLAHRIYLFFLSFGSSFYQSFGSPHFAILSNSVHLH